MLAAVDARDQQALMQASQAALQATAAAADAARLHSAAQCTMQSAAVLKRATDATSSLRELRRREAEINFSLAAAQDAVHSQHKQLESRCCDAEPRAGGAPPLAHSDTGRSHGACNARVLEHVVYVHTSESSSSDQRRFERDNPRSQDFANSNRMCFRCDTTLWGK